MAMAAWRLLTLKVYQAQVLVNNIYEQYFVQIQQLDGKQAKTRDFSCAGQCLAGDSRHSYRHLRLAEGLAITADQPNN